MEDLKELVTLINGNKLKEADRIRKNQTSMINRLYSGLVRNQFSTDEEAADFFFPDSPNKNIYFNRLKRQLKDRLIDNLFLIDVSQPQYTTLQSAYHICYRNLAAAKILIGRYLRKTAIPILERTVYKAQKFEFTEILLEAARALRLHYGPLVGDQDKFNYYNSLVAEASETLMAELKAETYYAELASQYARSKSSKLGMVDIAVTYSEELKAYLEKHRSYKVNYLSYLVFAFRYEIANDYENTAKTCEAALRFFESKKEVATNAAVFTFLFKLLGCNLQLKRYPEAEKNARQCLKLVPAGSFNWFLTQYYYLILCFHSGDFQKGYSIYHQATSHPHFEQQYQTISEQWRLFEAFFFYFVSIGKIKTKKNDQSKRFRLSKFMNEVPLLAKDKRGANINLLILQILFLLKEGKYSEIIDRMEPLKTYNHRYLRHDDTFRANCFLKMLLQLPQNSFHRAAVIRKAEKYWKQLQSVPLDVANQSSEIEIVPYETLWGYILESLDERFHHR